MFGRHVTLKLKVNSAEELSRINESKIIPLLREPNGFRNASLFVAPGNSEAIANSSWDPKEDAAAYHTTVYPFSNVTEGTPMVESFEVADSGFAKAASKSA